MNVGFVVHARREAAAQTASELMAWLADRGVTSRSIDATDTAAAGGADGDRATSGLDLVVSVGGDGTFLRAAYVAARDGCPVLGVKVGRMGFLTEVEPEGAAAALERVIDGTALIEERLAVVAEPDGAAAFAPQWALNEVMVEKRARHRLISLALIVDGSYVTTFSADGVIVATPTGSTAYSFSARGPIVTPTVPCIVVTPVAAHMVFDRSFVLPSTQAVTLEVVGEEPGLISADGRESLELPVGGRVRIRAAARPVHLVRRDDAPGFLTLVREKFGLPGDPAEGPMRGSEG